MQFYFLFAQINVSCWKLMYFVFLNLFKHMVFSALVNRKWSLPASRPAYREKRAGWEHLFRGDNIWCPSQTVPRAGPTGCNVAWSVTRCTNPLPVPCDYCDQSQQNAWQLYPIDGFHSCWKNIKYSIYFHIWSPVSPDLCHTRFDELHW